MMGSGEDVMPNLSPDEALDAFETDITMQNQECLCISERESEIKAAIYQLQKDVDELDNSGINNTTLGGNKSSVGVTGDISLSEADISQQLKQAQQFQEQLKADVEELQQRLTCNKERMEKMKTADQQTKTENSAQLPASKSVLALYKHISMIRFNLEVPEDEIRGYVCNSKSMQTFNLNKKQNSQFYITNYLWDLMKTD